MVEIIGFDMTGGYIYRTIGTYESVQMTGTDLRDADGDVILRYDRQENIWFDNTGLSWYDWTVGPA